MTSHIKLVPGSPTPQPITGPIGASSAGSAGAQGFPMGFHNIHPNVSLNFQLNRFSDGSPVMIEAMRGVASKISDYRDYIREMTALSDAAFHEGHLLRGALYLGSAHFYMFPGDPAKDPARRKFVATMREVFGVEAAACHEIPYEARRLFAYRFTPPLPRSTIVVCGGFDGHIEEFFLGLLFLRDAGYDVVAFDGPGQGTTLEDSGLPMTPIWHRPVVAVLNYFDLADVTLLGLSLGGCLMLRAAAYERRAKRVVCDDILPDFHGAILRQLSASQRLGLRVLLKAKASALVNATIGAAMRTSLVIEWGMKQGMLVTGTSSPYEFLRESMRYETTSVSSMVEQDVLLLAGAEDHYVPLEQFSRQLRMLTKPRSLTARLFTRQEQAQNHIHVGNIGLSLNVIVRWLEGLQARDRSSPAR